MTTLPELKGGEKLRLPSGVVVTVLRDRSRAARRAAEFDEPQYRLAYPARMDNGWRMPGIVGNMLLTLDDLGRLDAEVIE